jgi:lysozyme
MNQPVLLTELEHDEGMRLRPYYDSVGKLTIGIGRNLTDVGISKEEAYRLLSNDVEKAIADLDSALPWWRSLSENRQRALANMAFNMGLQRLQGFRDALGKMQRGDFAGAATAMLESQWAKQVGVRAQRLAEMMRAG